MSDIDVKPETIAKPKTKQPPLHKVILFVVSVLKAVFHTSEDQAYGIMLTAHQRGACVVAVFTREIAETKASEATDLGRRAGHPLTFTTEPEE